ncbi:MAG: DUF4365 domain-containing protein [Candidatus Gracilibacteria bacterium]|nr:DUF4365 domain-containing protein [Candidatus Gracilibacteria bacterium]
MSKYKEQNRLDEKAISIISNFFTSKYGDLFDLQFHGIKDNTPDTDGFLRLREKDAIKSMEGKNLNQVVFFQLKGQKNIVKNNSYCCEKKLIDFCSDINLPTILFVVGAIDSEAEQGGCAEIYWYHFSRVNKDILDTISKRKESRTVTIPNLEPLKISEKTDNAETFYSYIKSLAKKNAFLDTPKPVLDLATEYKDNIVKVGSVLYLVGRLKDKNLLSNILDLEQVDIDLALYSLLKKELIYSEQETFIFKQVEDGLNNDIGLLLVYETISQLNLERLFSLFSTHSEKINIYKNLAKVRHPLINDFFNSHTDKLYQNLKNKTKELNNDDIFMELDLLEQYIYRVPKKSIGIIKLIINSKKPLKPKKITYKIFGTLQGKKHKDLIFKCVVLLEKIRYLEMKQVFILLVRISRHNNEKISKEAIRALNNLTKYNWNAIQNLGFGVQKYVIEEMQKWSDKKLKEDLVAILETCKQLLTPSYEGQSWKDYKTMTLLSGPLPVNNDLRTIREKTVELLKRLYAIVDNRKQKKEILNVLIEATQTSPYGSSEGLEEVVLKNTQDVLEFHIDIIRGADLSIAKMIEGHKDWFTKRFGKKLKRADELNVLLTSNEEYRVFKLFVGLDLKESHTLGSKKADEQRKSKIIELIKSGIGKNNKKDWEQRIISIVDSYSPDSTTSFSYFHFFLEELGKKQTGFALELIEKYDSKLKHFLGYLLQGIGKKSPRKFKEIIKNWVELNKNLEIASLVLGSIDKLDLSLMQKVFIKAKKTKNVTILNNIVYSIFSVPNQAKELKDLLVDVITELTKQSSSNWIERVWYNAEKPILGELNQKNIEVILDNLVLATKLNYYLEEMLTLIAERFPVTIIQFFEKRVIRKSKTDRRAKYRYDDIPFDIYDLRQVFNKHEKEAVEEILKWLAKKDENISWDWSAGHLLHSLFPNFPDILQKKLIEMIQSKDEKLIMPILLILDSYMESVSHKVCKEFVKTYGAQQKYKIEMFLILSQTGIVSGEYGLMNAYEQKKKDIQTWKRERSNQIQAFVKEYEEYLDGRIAYEKKRADEEIELLKRNMI